MQTVSTTFLTALRAKTKNLALVVEFYLPDAVPGANGFDPSDESCVLQFAYMSGISYCGRNYQQRVVKNGISSIRKTIDKKINNFQIRLSNADRVVADFEKSFGFTGLISVVRVIDRAVSTALADSLVLFVGRCDTATDIEKSSETAIITVQQILNQSDTPVPRRKFTVEDLAGRAQSDYEFEGFIYTPRTGSVTYAEKVSRGGILGLFGLKKNVTRTMAYSSHSDLQEETYLPLVFGRTQMKLITFAYEDRGTYIAGIGFWADGHDTGLSAIENVRSISSGFPLTATATKLGRRGGAADSPTTQGNDDPSWIAAGIYSRTALTRFAAGGTTLQSDDAAPEVVAMIFGQILPEPDANAVFQTNVCSDSAVAQIRWLLASKYFFNLPDAWHDDAENKKSFDFGNHSLIDRENTDTVLLPQSQTLLAGTRYKIYKSTAVLEDPYYRGATDSERFGIEADYRFYDNAPYNSDDWTGAGMPALPPTALRRRYTSNVALLEEMKAMDFIFDVLLPSSALFITQTSAGKIAIKNRRPADRTFLYASAQAAASEIQVKNINPFAVDGLVVVGANQQNSEARRITSKRYLTNPGVSVSASGGASVSSSILTNGSDTVPPSTTLSVSNASGPKTLNVGEISLTFVSDSSDTDVCAQQLAAYLNAHEEINKFIKAIYIGGGGVRVESRIGYLGLDNALENGHSAQLSNPPATPAVSAQAGGNLRAGTYQITYALTTAEGDTLASPAANITIGDNQNIVCTGVSIPSRVLAVRWYISSEPNGVRRKLININSGTGFTITNLPLADDNLEPIYNATASEITAIALAFADRAAANNNLQNSNVLKSTFKITSNKSNQINQVKIKFRDAAADYKLTTLIVNDRVLQKRLKKTNTLEINGAAIDNLHQARRIANQRLAENADGDRFVGFSSDNEALLLEEGDVIAVTDDSGRYVNELVKVEESTVSTGGGYPTVEFSARKYRSYYYDDQVQERVVPLPLVQNNPLNTEQIAPTIYINSITNQTLQIGIRNYSTDPYFRRIRVSNQASFPQNATRLIVHNAANEVGFLLKEFVDIPRATNLGVAETVYIQVSHSSNGVKWGAWSEILPATYPAPPPPAPSAPAYITTVNYNTNDGKIYGYFNPADGGGNYELQYNPGSGWATLDGNLDGSTTIFIHSIAMQAYEQIIGYKLRKLNSSAWSNEFYATVPAAAATPPLPGGDSNNGNGSGGNIEPPPTGGGGGGVGGCFTGNTPFNLMLTESISFADLYKRRAEFIGKEILSFDASNNYTRRKLLDVWRVKSNHFIVARFSNGAKRKVTPTHRFWTTERKFVSICHLKAGDKVYDKNWDVVEIESVGLKAVKHAQWFYNATVETDRAYFVEFPVSNNKPLLDG